jgi:alkaline phosphatase D
VLKRRAAAYQAYYEAMPLRRRSLPRGPDMDLYRAARFGRLAAFHVLDTRQYRTPQPGVGRVPLGAAATNPNATILGARQSKWLRTSLAESTATWNVLAQQVMMAMIDAIPGEEKGYHSDQWPAYTRDRVELMRFIAERKVRNPVALAGDIHSNWVNDLRVDDRQADAPIVATEFVGTSISSGGNGVERPVNLDTLMAENGCMRFHNRERGYVRCEVTPRAWRSDFVTVTDVTTPNAPTRIRASFAVEAGRPGAQPA